MKTTVADVMRRAEDLLASAKKNAEQAYKDENMSDICFYGGARMALAELIGYMQQMEKPIH